MKGWTGALKRVLKTSSNSWPQLTDSVLRRFRVLQVPKTDVFLVLLDRELLKVSLRCPVLPSNYFEENPPVMMYKPDGAALLFIIAVIVGLALAKFTQQAHEDDQT